MTDILPLEDREISSLPGLNGFQVNPLFCNNVRTVGEFERLTKNELECLVRVGSTTIRKVQAAIDSERRRENAQGTELVQRDIVDVLDELASFLERDGDRNVVPRWLLMEAADEIRSARRKLADIKVLVDK